MKGIAVAGSMLTDKIYEIENYPKSGELAKILNISLAAGGCVPNVAADIKTVCPEIPVYAFGRAGRDGDGKFIEDCLSRAGVDTSNIVYCNQPTSFTAVMSIRGGQRTFFTYAGASAEFCADDVNLDACNIGMLHLGYFLLLDKIDGGDGLKLLKRARKRGIKTSVDLVSENSPRYGAVRPCLKYVDNLIINEFEAAYLAGADPTAPLCGVAQKLKELGVSERVIIHRPDVSVCLSERGFTSLGSYELPAGFIKGTTGAGDAFCAGALIGIYGNADDKSILEFASAAAVSSLSAADAVSGMRRRDEVEKLCNNFKRRNICL